MMMLIFSNPVEYNDDGRGESVDLSTDLLTVVTVNFVDCGDKSNDCVKEDIDNFCQHHGTEDKKMMKMRVIMTMNIMMILMVKMMGLKMLVMVLFFPQISILLTPLLFLRCILHFQI